MQTSPILPRSRFTDLQRQRPDLTVAQIINSNNYTEAEIASGRVDLKADPVIPENADAVVVGAGMAGLIFAIHLKKIKPDAVIIVLERSAQPTYKIGESTLSTFSRFCQSHIMSSQYMLRLFNIKEGLDFVYLNEHNDHKEYQDIGGLDNSFQLERKVSELLFTLKAQRMGVKVFYGVSVDGRGSDIICPTLKTLKYTLSPSISSPTETRRSHEAPESIPQAQAMSRSATTNPAMNRAPAPAPVDADRLKQRGIEDRKRANLFSKMFGGKKDKYSNPAVVNVPSSAPVKAVPPPPPRQPIIKAKIVADASGLTQTIAKQLVKTEKFPGMDFDAYWAYFKEDMTRMEKSIKNYEYPGSLHLCMKDGWSWWIRLVTWEKSPRGNMMDMITYILDNVDAGIDERLVPCMDKLAAMFGCTHERIVSIGFTVRSESVATLPSFPHLSPKASENEKRFWGIVHKYPVLEKVLYDSGRYSILEKYYGPIFGTYFARKSISYRQTAIAGPGWFAMGNASGFTSPLFSPGINCIALPQAYLAGNLAKRHLETGEEVWDEYQYRMGEIQIPGLRMVDRFLYSMFRDVRLFHLLFPLYFANGIGEISTNYQQYFSEGEIHWSLGSTAPVFQKMAPELLPLIEGLPSEPVSDETIAQVAIMCEGYRKMAVDLYSRHTQYSRYMRFMGDDLKPCPGKIGRFPGDFGGRRCTSCKHGNTQDRVECISCGSDLPPMIHRPLPGVEIVKEGSCKKEVLEAYERAKEREGRVTPDSAVMVEEQLKREMNGIQGAQVSAAA